MPRVKYLSYINDFYTDFGKYAKITYSLVMSKTLGLFLVSSEWVTNQDVVILLEKEVNIAFIVWHSLLLI